MIKVLVADDERDLAVVVAFGVRMTWPGCTVQIASDGAEALRLFEAEAPNLVILDVEMPLLDGFEVCRRIRAVSQVPILMLTVRDATLDKVHALDLGADDYLTKPFEHPELLARLRALIRRTQTPSPASDQLFTAGELTINTVTHEVHLRNELIQLTSIEYRVLYELVRHTGTTLSHRYLLERVWGEQYINETQYLKVIIQRLRNKLGDDADIPTYIRTEWGTGYQFIPRR
jgi:DNA-binding response OmpR family regulator